MTSYEEAKQLENMKIPRNAQDVSSWREGDNIKFGARGGLTLFGGIHFYSLAMGVAGTFIGEWNYTVKKLNENKVQVVISKKNIKGLKAKAGVVLLANAGISVDKIFEKDLTFILDLADAHAQEAFKVLINGNLTNAQKMASNAISDEVKWIRTHKESTLVKAGKLHLGIPFLVSKDLIKAKVKRFDQTIDHENGLQIELKTSSLQTRNLFKIIKNPFKKGNWQFHRFKHVNYKKTQNGAAYTTKSVDPNQNGEQKGPLGEIVWKYTNDNTTKAQAESAVKKFMKSTCLGPALAVSFDKLDGKNLGYLGIKFKVTVGNEATEELISKLTSDGDALSKAGEAIVDEYFAKGDTRKLCTNNKGNRNEGCVTKLKNKVKESLNLIKQALLKVNEDGQHESERSLLMATVARIMKKKTFVLMSVIKVSSLIQAKYRVEGEKFVALEKDFVFEN